VLISGSPVINEQGMITGSAGIHWDITPMIEMEEMLHDKEIQRQRSILQASIRTEEKQKQTLGRELHDGLGQMLAYISLNMQLMLDKKATSAEIVESTKVLINKTIADIRQLSRMLIPVALDSTKTLKEILSEALASFVNMKGLRFDFVVYDPAIDQKLSLDQKHSIFRILQELTNNTIKYAEAGQITVSIRDTGKQCAIRYTDDGKGFTKYKVKKGVGFESIETRVESYQGKLSIQSGKGKGIKVQISIPYSRQKIRSESE
jgi:signal transduction histidine kinase